MVQENFCYALSITNWLCGLQQEKTFQKTRFALTVNITPADYTFNYGKTTDSACIGTALPTTDNTAQGDGVNSEKVGGTLTWYTNSARTAAATGTFTAVGSKTLYWKFVPSDSNYVTTPKTGSVVYTVTSLPTQNVAFAETTVNKTYGDSSFTKTAGNTTVGGGTISYSSSNTNVAAVNATTGEVTIVGAGTATITATAAEVAATYAQTSAVYTLTVAPRVATLAWNPQDGTLYYNGQTKTVTASVSNLVGNDQVSVTVIGGSKKDIGSYQAKADKLTGAHSANYTLPTDGTQYKTYTIKPVLDTVNATSADGKLTATVSGLTVKLVGYVKAGKDITITAKLGGNTVPVSSGTIAAANISKTTNAFSAGGVTYAVDTTGIKTLSITPDAQPQGKASGTNTSSLVAGTINKAIGNTQGVTDVAVYVNAADTTESNTLNIEVTANVVSAAGTEKKILHEFDAPVQFAVDLSGMVFDCPQSVFAKHYTGTGWEYKEAGGSWKWFYNNTVADFVSGNYSYEMLPVTMNGTIGTFEMSGASPVTFKEDARTSTVTFHKASDDVEIITFKADAIGTALPTASQTGKTFKGWNFYVNGSSTPVANGPYTKMTDALLEAIKAGTITASASFAAESSGNPGGGGGGAVSATLLNIVVNNTSNGTVTASAKTAAAGNSVTLTIAPASDYKLDKLTVTDADGKAISLNKISENTYSFTMPKTAVTVSASFAIATIDTMNFSDVSTSNWFYNSVKYVYDNGLMNGVEEGSFGPRNTTTRGMICTVLARNAGAMTSGGEHWYTNGMNWAKQQGISDGTMPESNITREQLASMLYRAAQKECSGFSGAWMFPLNYPDASSVHSWANEAMHWCIMNGIINGKNGELVPTGYATRAEVATMLMRYLELGK